ncbi:alpha/beta fold hydrolase [Auraticoccus monumenti]|uniref:Pimeloyl-ACP methyl ester carboxylesterase n=1 Tax=Auraticoccus monumenti TaxID=675864 RepID=A0A1G7BS98_9ACTN|nr:alpha/beta hydrolase [Auraticoccus monumenti]SDE29246.1 Pimeloyl-ACP methyl ester carboxylesterase [Auraticoccus monumenti]
MTTITASTAPGLSHHRAAVNGTELHYVTAGDAGSPVLLVHGFPESWWAFRAAIPLLAERHRVVAVDLRGFGDSRIAERDHDSATAAEDLHQLIASLGLGPVHLLAQDISGGTAYRLVRAHPEDVLSFTGVEMGLAGFGLEGFADVTSGGSWHIGVLAAPDGLGELLLSGHERELLGSWAFPTMTAVPDAVTGADVDEMSRGYARPGGWRGAVGLYRSMLAEGEELRHLARERVVDVPALAVGGGGGPFTAATLSQVFADVSTAQVDGVGHYVALEAPGALAEALLAFLASTDVGHPERPVEPA